MNTANYEPISIIHLDNDPQIQNAFMYYTGEKKLLTWSSLSCGKAWSPRFSPSLLNALCCHASGQTRKSSMTMKI